MAMVKSISPHGNFDSEIVKGKFLEGDVPKPLKKLKDAESGGFNYSIYKGEWDLLPDFSSLKSVDEGIAGEDFSLESLSELTNFACLLEGFIKIEEEGNYVFVLNSDDGSKLFLGGKPILDNNGLHTADNAKTFALPMKEGFYPFRLEYFQKGGEKSLNMLYVTPGSSSPSPIPLELLFYTK